MRKPPRGSRAIRNRLARADPGNAGWQRGVLRSCRRRAWWRDGRAIRDRLAKADSGDAGWASDLSVSHSKLASVFCDVLVEQGNLPEALKSFLDGRARDQRPAWRRPTPATPGWQHDLSMSHSKLASVF
jgi:hypothetical protein